MSQERKLYKIGHITKLLGITSRTIRYYEQFGLLPHIKRSDGKIRLYDDEDIDIIKKIRRMQKEQFLPLDLIKENLFGKKSTESTQKIAIVTDSSATIPSTLDLPQNNIFIVPLSLMLGDKLHEDNKGLSPTWIWEKASANKLRITTRPVSEEAFIQKYLMLFDQGYQEIYSVHLSGKFSQTIHNAHLAAHKVSDKIKVNITDSNSVGAGLGLLVRQISAAIDAGSTSQEINLLITKNTPLIFDIMTLNSLWFLSDGGKIPLDPSSIRNALLTNLFNFKPILQMKDGSLDIIECCKDKNRALDHMLDILQKEIKTRGGYVTHISIIYNHLYGEALELINKIKDIYRHTGIHISEGSAVVSAYVGPESIGISII